MKDYELKKRTLLMKQNICCEYCGEKFTESDKIELAHRLINSKANIKLFGEAVINHVLNLGATHPKKCNDGLIINRSTRPVEAYELIVNILSHILLDDPTVFEYNALLKAFDNIETRYIVNPVSIAQYDILNNFFEHYREL